MVGPNYDVGRLAQLVRASGLHPEGRGFESLSAHHLKNMKFILGIILSIVGFTLVWKTEGWFSFFGRIAWAEKYLGTEGGSRLFYKLIGILIIIVGLLLITGLYDSFMQTATNPLVN